MKHLPVRRILRAAIPLFLFALCALLPVAHCAGESLRYDSSQVLLRHGSPDSLAVLRADLAFQYEKPEPETESIWDVIKRKLDEWFNTVFGSTLVGGAVGTILIIVLMLLVLALVVVMFTGTRMSSIFAGKSDEAEIEMHEVEEDIHEMGLEDLIREATEQGQYRKAIRLYYLLCLRELAEQHLIAWKKDKTNSDYLRELQGHPLHDQFGEITRFFDYIWYGDFSVDAGLFALASERFQTLRTSVRNGEPVA